MQDNYLDCSFYKGHSRSNNGFSTFVHKDEFYFSYIDESGNVILRSEGYKSEVSRDNGIQSVMKNMDNDDRYKTIQLEDGSWVLSLKAANHQEIAQSCPVSTEEAAKNLLPSERSKARAAALAMFSSKSNSSLLSSAENENYLICREYEERIVNSPSDSFKDIIEFQHENGQYYFAWVIDGKIVMRSEGYLSKTARDNGIASVIKNRVDKDKFKTLESHGTHFFILKAGNGQEIARSCPKNSAEEVKLSLDLLVGLGTVGMASVVSNEEQIVEISEVNIESPKLEAPKVESSVLDAFKTEVPIIEDQKLKEDIPEVKIEPSVVEIPEEKIEQFKDNIILPIINNPKEETNQKFKVSEILEEEKTSNWKWLLWLFGCILLFFILWVLFNKGCKNLPFGTSEIVNVDSNVVSDDVPIDTNIVIDNAGKAAKVIWDSILGEMVNIDLPNGQTILVPINGSEKKLVEFLNAGCNGELKKTWFNLDRILFITGSNKLNSVSNEQLNIVNQIIQAYPSTKFKIGGYTDNVGDSLSNVKLSASRAKTVLKALELKGAIKKLRSEGYGPMHPICPENNTPECKALNRRVSIRVDTCGVVLLK